jgi:hypothetical protein
MNTVTALLEPRQNGQDNGFCLGLLTGLVVWLFPEEEPDHDPAPPKVFLGIQLRHCVVAVIDRESVDYDDIRRFVLRETSDGTFRGQVAGFHASAAPIGGGCWLLTLSDVDPTASELSLDDVSRRLHEEPGGDV